MFKSLVSFIKGLFVKVEINQEQLERVASCRTDNGKDTHIVLPAVKKKTLDDRLKDVAEDLPSYAKGRKLPPKAKLQYIQAKKPR